MDTFSSRIEKRTVLRPNPGSTPNVPLARMFPFWGGGYTDEIFVWFLISCGLGMGCEVRGSSQSIEPMSVRITGFGPVSEKNELRRLVIGKVLNVRLRTSI